MPALATRVAAQQAPGGQVAASGGPVLLQRLQRIGRARGREAAGRAQPGAEEEAIAANQRDQQRVDDAGDGPAGGAHPQEQALKNGPHPAHEAVPRADGAATAAGAKAPACRRSPCATSAWSMARISARTASFSGSEAALGY